jgi:hypothetical protein
VFILNGTVANSEFARTQHVSSSTINLVDAITNTQNSSTVLDQIDEFALELDVSAWTRIRVAFFNPSGQTVYVESYMISADSVG